MKGVSLTEKLFANTINRWMIGLPIIAIMVGCTVIIGKDNTAEQTHRSDSDPELVIGQKKG